MLKSYVKHHYKGVPLNLMLIDNGSDDDSYLHFVENGLPVFRFGVNHGHEQSLNIMYNEIHTEYVALCDTDVIYTANTHEAYLPQLTGNVVAAGEYITGDRLHDAVRPRLSPWFMMFNIHKMKEAGVNKFRDSEDWSYDVASWYTEKMQEKGFSFINIPRAGGHIDYDLLGMVYPTHIHLGKLSWNLENHPDRYDEVMRRRAYVREKLEEFKDVNLNGKFIYE